MGLMHAVAGVAVCSRCPHLLLRVDAVDGANHSLIQLFLEPPPLRLGPAVKRTAVRSCTGYEINDSGESRLTFPVAGTDTVPVERPGENSNVCSHLSLCMRRYEWGGGTRCTHRGVDFAVVRGHAVSMVEVGEGLGRSPRLQVTGHSNRRPHFPTVQRGSRAHSQQRALSVSLG